MVQAPASAALFRLSTIIFDHFILYIKITKLQESSMEKENIVLKSFFLPVIG